METQRQAQTLKALAEGTLAWLRDAGQTQTPLSLGDPSACLAAPPTSPPSGEPHSGS